MAAALDPSDTGTDVYLFDDIPLRWGLASGRRNLVARIVRGLSMEPGALYFAPERGGVDLIGALNAGFTQAELGGLRSRIVAQVERDPAVQSCAVVLTADFATSELRVELTVTDKDGPFPLVLRVSDLTIDILNAGQPAAAAAPATTVAPSFAGPPGTPGADGPAGQAGPAGPAGVPDVTLDYPGGFGDDTGAEVVVRQWTVDFGALGASLAADLTLRALSASGNATVRLRVAGTFDTADGTVVGSVTVTGASFATYQITGSFSNPTGIKAVKLTLQSSAAATDAQGKDVVGRIA